jgi:hypothetical protein
VGGNDDCSRAQCLLNRHVGNVKAARLHNAAHAVQKHLLGRQCVLGVQAPVKAGFAYLAYEALQGETGQLGTPTGTGFLPAVSSSTKATPTIRYAVSVNTFGMASCLIASRFWVTPERGEVL